MPFFALTPEEEQVIVHKGTEPPFSGQYTNFQGRGTYVCKRCHTPLFVSSAKFPSHCGWPSFDDAIPGAVKQVPDADGKRTEIVCAACEGHIGHVFVGEGFTSKNIRHCANSLSLHFIPDPATVPSERAIFASGCFWGTQYYLQRVKGVLATTVGYCGGDVTNPTYAQVCSGTSGHAEAVAVDFNPQETSYEELAKRFFETHDFSQVNRQGPDSGEQYRSEIFYRNETQRQTAAKLIAILKEKGYQVATRLTPAGQFWPAEEYHQQYYQKKGGSPYCHLYRQIF